ncbi:uncharacterized protein LOC143452263 isoform X2 [Clavelina lepadiformis]|uniref:uncharacterized protein LOC143452263 isoform X2 n=1 Tax=Clavelina lepadiformis TaxID=159417 RepID=UPI00404379B9
MNWSNFCDEVIKHGGLHVEYAYLQNRDKILGEKRKYGKFPYLTFSEASIIVRNLIGSNFQLRDERYKLWEINGEVFTYVSPTRCIVYGAHSTFFLIVCGISTPTPLSQCQKAVA